MNRIVSWLQQRENRVFLWVNQKMRNSFFDHFFTTITHLGGATFTIAAALCLSIFGQDSWRLAGMQSCIALAISHVPVALIKKNYPRLRPYLVLKDTKTYKNPLTDHSFPSGHTTAIFSITIPLFYTNSWLGTVLLPVASLVGVSRMYLGLHYPSDCLVGCIIGTAAAFGAVILFT
jgi:undecaprenyl-diphosphatase